MIKKKINMIKKEIEEKFNTKIKIKIFYELILIFIPKKVYISKAFQKYMNKLLIDLYWDNINNIKFFYDEDYKED